MTGWLHDLRISLRNLVRSPLFCLVAVLTLGLGIGASTAVYTAVDAVLLRALPYPDGHRLVALWVDARANDMPRQEWTNPADFGDWQRGLTTVETMAAWTGWIPTLSGRGEAIELAGMQVTGDYFRVLGVAPLLGRGLGAEDDQPNGPAVVVISHALWRDHLGAPEQLGQSIELNGIAHEVVGVMPAGFATPMTADRQVWRPLQADPASGRGNAYLRVLARLAPGYSVETAQAEFSALQRQLATQYPDTNGGFEGYVQPLHAALGEGLQRQLWVMQVATTLLLAIACANLANLLLARASLRSREYALRASLGASRARIARQLLLESTLLGAAGALLGLLVAYVGAGWIGTLLPAELTQLAPLTIDLRVVGFATLLALVCGLLFGLIPALGAGRLNLANALQSGERGGQSRAALRLRAALVAGTFALSLALCVGAGLFMKSLQQLQAIDPGFEAEQVLSLRLLLPRTRYADADALRQAQVELQRQLGAVPGVEQISLTSTLPMGEGSSDTAVRLDGDADAAPRRLWYSQTSPEYLSTLRIPLRLGRGIEATDRDGSAPVVVVNQAFVAEYLNGDDPLGRRINFGSVAAPEWTEIVGVAGDVRFFGLAEAQTPSAYVPAAQYPPRSFYLVLRGRGDPLELMPQLRVALAKVDPLLAVTPMTMQARVEQGLMTPRMIALLSAGFAAMAMLLAAIGIYGLIAYTVSSRTREFGVRLALGASAARLLRHVLGIGLRLALTGVTVGVLLSLLLGRAVNGLLYQVQAHDPLVLAGVATLLCAVAVAASLPPALRTLRVQPTRALRYE